MNLKDLNIVKSILGDDILETLEKYEIYKPETKTVVDPNEIRVALEIVPRSVLSFLFANLKSKNVGDIIDLDLPFEINSRLHLEKKGPDNYNGEIIKDGKKLSEFKYRSLPSIGLILLTCFELYDLKLLSEIKQNIDNPTIEEHLRIVSNDDKMNKLQDIIDERLALHRLVNDVVEKKIAERDAINRIIKEKLHSHIEEINKLSVNNREKEQMEENKKSKLKQFLENREKKNQESVKEFDKNEIGCPDCGTNLYKSEYKNKIKLCLCYGEYMNKEIKFSKNENGTINFKFPKNFEVDNIEMLIEAFKK